MPRIVLLTGLPTKCAARWQYLVVRRVVDVDALRAVIARAVAEDGFELASYVGHESTAKVLSQVLGFEVEVNRAEWDCDPEDLAIIAVLRYRPKQPGDIEAKPEDVELYLATPLRFCGSKKPDNIVMLETVTSKLTACLD